MASEPPISYEDYKGMLSVFRVPELQALLSSCGRCRSGRKGELVNRAITLIKPNHESSLSRKAKSRIVELYRLRFPESNIGFSDSSTLYPPPYQKDDKILSPVHNEYSNMSKLNSSPRTSISKSTSAVPIHPDVHFCRLPFQELTDVLVKPTSLVQKSLNGYQQMQIGFHLTPHQVQLISHARSYSIQGKVEYSVQVVLRNSLPHFTSVVFNTSAIQIAIAVASVFLLRVRSLLRWFCLAETSCVQDDLYPLRCSVLVNGRSCPLPGQLPSNHNIEPKKPHRPINLTHYCRLSPMSAEQIRLNWLPSDMGQRFTATVELVKVMSSSALLQKLKAKAERNADHSRALIKEKLMHDPDSEIATTSLKVSLCCPIGRMKMSLPCRSSTCTHVQCFDAALYIQMNERKPSWICPVCDQKAYYEQLVIDGLFSEIIRSAPEAEEIVFFQDGSWKPLSDLNDVDNKPSKALLDRISLSPGTPDTGKPKDGQQEKRSDVVVIDLISDSEDEAGCSSISMPTHADLMTTQSSVDSTDLPPLPPLVPSASCAFEDSSGQQRGKGPRFRHVTHINAETALQEPQYYSQSLIDLYSILPPADRLAAALYLDQAGLLGNSGGPSTSDIISLD